jgi:CTP synthase (UTP-ammonia lyase)
VDSTLPPHLERSTTDVPLIGTCAGFQRSVIEFARNILGIADAHHAEYESGTGTLVVDALACSLRGQTLDVTLEPHGTSASAGLGPPARGILNQ